MLVASLKSFGQSTLTDGTTNPDLNPPVHSRCGVYCFKNTSNCYAYVCISSNELIDPCVDGGISYDPVFQCLSLEAGEAGCIDLGLSSYGNCYVCPKTYVISVCGNNSYPCFSFSQGTNGGEGITNCGGPYVHTSCYLDPATGVYLIKRP